MGYDILIERLRSVYRIPAGTGDPGALQRRLDEIAGRRLPDALDSALSRALAGLGLDPKFEIAIDRLAVRIRLRDSNVDDEALADAWARGIAEAMTKRLAPIAARGGGVGDGVAIFADQLEAERAYLADRFAGVAEAWWHRQVIGAREARLPAPREVIERWIREAPERVPGDLAALLLHAGFVPGDVLSDAEAFALAEAIEGSRAARLRTIAAELYPARRGAGATGKPGSESDLAASGARRDAAAPPRSGALAWPLAAPERLRPLLAAREIEAVAAVGGPGAKRLLLTCILLARRPSTPELALLAASLEQPEVGSGADAEALQQNIARARAASGSEAARATSEATRQSSDHTSARAAAPTGSGHREQAHSAAAAEERERGEHSIGCGGLLFLVRRVAASPLLDHHRGLSLEERLVALGQIALDRVLGLLPEGARRAAFERERPTLAVFSGAPLLPDALHVLPEGPAAREATELLDALSAELPIDLAPCVDGALTTYGPDIDPFGPDHPARPLAHLLLRPGRLAITRTRADLSLPARAVDVALRIGGWDIDPGFVPYLGRVIRFHYELEHRPC